MSTFALLVWNLDKQPLNILKMDPKKQSYAKPLTTRKAVRAEGNFCASEPIRTMKATVEVDEWVTIENDITFE